MHAIALHVKPRATAALNSKFLAFMIFGIGYTPLSTRKTVDWFLIGFGPFFFEGVDRIGRGCPENLPDHGKGGDGHRDNDGNSPLAGIVWGQPGYC